MQIRSVGIDLGKTTFHLVALGDDGKVLLKKKFTAKAAHRFHSQPADFADRDGGMLWRSLPGSCVTSTGS